MVQLLWQIVGRFLKILKTELPYDPAIPPLDIYLKHRISGFQRDTRTSVFTAA